MPVSLKNVVKTPFLCLSKFLLFSGYNGPSHYYNYGMLWWDKRKACEDYEVFTVYSIIDPTCKSCKGGRNNAELFDHLKKSLRPWK